MGLFLFYGGFFFNLVLSLIDGIVREMCVWDMKEFIVFWVVMLLYEC